MVKCEQNYVNAISHLFSEANHGKHPSFFPKSAVFPRKYFPLAHIRAPAGVLTVDGCLVYYVMTAWGLAIHDGRMQRPSP